MGKPMFGFTYPTVTGENATTAFRRILGEFPDMQMWSHYYNGTDLPSWGEAWFNEAPDDCIFLISVKHTDVMAIGNRIAQMPEKFRGRVIMFLHHEPDQWRSASDPKGDPSPSVWIQRQIDFADLRESSPWQSWVQHGVCFTEDRYRTDTAIWEQNWGDTIGMDPRIDVGAFDCFNIGRSVTRAGADIFAKPLAWAQREGVPLIIREYGQVTPVDSPVDSQGVADQIRENWAWAKANGDGTLIGLVWYYNHNNTLVDPSGTRPGRPLTKAAITEIMADASTPDEEEPDPEHPQYQLGYQAGVDSRNGEVSALENRIEELVIERDNAKAAGRIEAFGEVVNWAQDQE